MREGWRSARINGNPRYIYGLGAYDGLILRRSHNKWLVEWYEWHERGAARLPNLHRETLSGSFTEDEAQAAALAVWRMR